MERKYIIAIIGIIAIIAVAAGIYYMVFLSEPEMRTETIEGVTVLIPADAKLVKNAYGNYEDKKLGIQLSVSNSSAELTGFSYGLNQRKDIKRTELEGISPNAISYRSDAGWTDILVVNSNASKGILVGAKNERLAIKMANSVVFNNVAENITETSSSKYIGESKAISIMKSASPDGAPGAIAILTTYKGRPMYKVSWEGNYAYIDAVTGTIYDMYGATSDSYDSSSNTNYDDYYYDSYDDYYDSYDDESYY